MTSIAIEKGPLHSKLIGNCGEALICNWLSRSGFEVALVDHTGIDVVAFHPPSGRRLGITIKSRTRTRGTESDPVHIFKVRKEDRKKVAAACVAFNSEPWLGVYVESEVDAHVYLIALSDYDRKYRKEGKAVDVWGMRPSDLVAYEHDPAIRHIYSSFKGSRWTWDSLVGPWPAGHGASTPTGRDERAAEEHELGNG